MEIRELRNMVAELTGSIKEASSEDDTSGETSSKGIFKFSPKALRLLSQHAGLESPQKELLDFQRKVLGQIDADMLPKLWGEGDKGSVQDLIKHNPKRAMVLWTRNVRRVHPKLKKWVEDNPDKIHIYYYATIVKLTDRDTADVLLKKHFSVQDSEEEGVEMDGDDLGLFEQNSKRKELEDRVWKKKHKNYKMIIQRGANKGKRAVVHLDKETGIAALSPLDKLSVAELMHMLGK